MTANRPGLLIPSVITLIGPLFAALGTAVECDTKEEYDLLAAASALMGT